MIESEQLVYTGLQVRADHADQIAIDIRFEGIPESLEDQYFKLARASGGVPFVQCAGAVWNAREKMFGEATDAVVCKCSVLPKIVPSASAVTTNPPLSLPIVPVTVPLNNPR